MHLHRLAVVAGIIGTGLGVLCGAAHAEPGWYVGMSNGPVRVVAPTIQQELAGSHVGIHLALSSDGDTLVVVSNDTLGVLDAHTLATRNHFFTLRHYNLVALSPDDTQVAISTGPGNVEFYDFTLNEFRRPTSLGAVRVSELLYSPDGRFIYATTSSSPAPPPNGAIVVIDAIERQVVDQIPLPPGARRMVISADGGRAYVAAGLSLWEVDLIDRRVTRSWYAGAPVADVALGRDERRAYIVFGNSDGTSLGTIDLDAGAMVSSQQLAACSEPSGIALAADGRSLAITLERFSALVFVDIETGAVSALGLEAAPRGLVAADLEGIAPEGFRPLPAITPEDLFVCGTTIAIADASGAPGDTIDIAVGIESEPGTEIAGIQNQIVFDPQVLTLDPNEGCSIEPAIAGYEGCDDNPLAPCKDLHINVQPCDRPGRCPDDLTGWTTVRALVLSLANVNPFPPGVVYRCRFQIRPDAVPETSTSLRCHDEDASDPDGDGLPMTCRDGHVSIVPPGSPAPAPTATSVPSVDRPLGNVDSEVTTVDAGGCQTAPTSHPLSLLLLVPPLLTLAVRRRRQRLVGDSPSSAIAGTRRTTTAKLAAIPADERHRDDDDQPEGITGRVLDSGHPRSAVTLRLR